MDQLIDIYVIVAYSYKQWYLIDHFSLYWDKYYVLFVLKKEDYDPHLNVESIFQSRM